GGHGFSPWSPVDPSTQEHGPGGSRCDTATGTRPTRFGYRTATAPGQTPGLDRFDGIPSSAPLGDQCLWRGTPSSQARQGYRPGAYGFGSWRGLEPPTCCLQDSSGSSTECWRVLSL